MNYDRIYTKEYTETINNIVYDVKERYYKDFSSKNYIAFKDYFLNNELFIKINFYVNGNIAAEIYYTDGKRNNEKEPAFISYDENGNILHKAYYINDKLHNENGPAEIHYYDNGKIEFAHYYLNDKYLDNITTDQELKEYLKFKNF